MGRVLADIGLHMLMEIAMGVIMLEDTDLQNVNLAVANQPRDGTIEMHERFCIKLR